MPSCYLAGPISGLNFGAATDWRIEARKKLEESGIDAYSPLRGKEYLATIGALSGHGREYADMGVLSTPPAVLTRDRFDCTKRDVVLMNLLGAEKVSIGTMMELAWADLARVPVVCAMEDQGNVHDHMMVTQAIGFRVRTLEDAIHVVKSILLPVPASSRRYESLRSAERFDSSFAGAQVSKSF